MSPPEGSRPPSAPAAMAGIVLASLAVLAPSSGCGGDSETSVVPRSEPHAGGNAGRESGGGAGKSAGGAAGKTGAGASGSGAAGNGAAGNGAAGDGQAGEAGGPIFGSAGSGAGAGVCGDGFCDHDLDEVCETCPGDCGACAVCGNGTCEKGFGDESCESCPGDCGACSTCGDGQCIAASGEDCTSCAADCGKCASCGDGACAADENCASCPGDCGGACNPCGNGKCDAGETCATCEDDCGKCDTCGDGECNGKDTCETCAKDCGKCERKGCVQGEFKPFWGGLHAHTHLSDGDGTPGAAFEHASKKTKPAMDFLYLSDHQGMLTQQEFKACEAAADKANKAGVFVAGCGYEKTVFNGKEGIGHFNALFVDKLRPLSFNIPGIYQAIDECGPCLGQFNHPPWPGTFQNWKFYPVAKDKVRLIEFNGHGAWDAKVDAYFTALDNGWKVSPSYNEDNHKGGWGNTSNATMIMAPTLSRASVRSAVFSNRTAATNDDTSSIAMLADDECWMGSTLHGFGASKITVTLRDKQQNDGFAGVTFYGPNRKALGSRDCKGENPCTVSLPLTVTKETYVVVIAHQKDGDVIVSGPIWYEK